MTRANKTAYSWCYSEVLFLIKLLLQIVRGDFACSRTRPPTTPRAFDNVFDLIWFDLIWFDLSWFDLIVLFYMDSLNKTRSLFYIKIHEEKKTLIKDIGTVNRVHLTVLVSVENNYILCIA